MDGGDDKQQLPVCCLCDLPCDQSVAELMEVTCQGANCDRNRLYHFECVRGHFRRGD